MPFKNLKKKKAYFKICDLRRSRFCKFLSLKEQQILSNVFCTYNVIAKQICERPSFLSENAAHFVVAYVNVIGALRCKAKFVVNKIRKRVESLLDAIIASACTHPLMRLSTRHNARSAPVFHAQTHTQTHAHAHARAWSRHKAPRRLTTMATHTHTGRTKFRYVNDIVRIPRRTIRLSSTRPSTGSCECHRLRYYVVGEIRRRRMTARCSFALIGAFVTRIDCTHRRRVIAHVWALTGARTKDSLTLYGENQEKTKSDEMAKIKNAQFLHFVVSWQSWKRCEVDARMSEVHCRLFLSETDRGFFFRNSFFANPSSPEQISSMYVSHDA